MRRDTRSTRVRSRACSLAVREVPESRLAVPGSACLPSLFLSDSFRHPSSGSRPGALSISLSLRLLLLGGVHLRQSFGEAFAARHSPQNGKGHFQIALNLFGCRGLCRLWLPAAFSRNSSGSVRMRSRTTQGALAPGGVKLRRLPGYRSGASRMRSPSALAIVRADALPHRHQILHRDLGAEISLRVHAAGLLPGNNSTSASRRDTQLMLRSKRRASSSSE